MTDAANPIDRADQIRRFEDTKLGVKGLVDSGLTTIPPLFVHPAESLSDLKLNRPAGRAVSIPIIDLSTGTREEAVEQVARAAREMGFFQVVNHGVAPEVLNRLIGAVRAFHEQDAESKQAKYTRTGRVSFFSNVDLFHSKAASWRDTLQIRLSPNMENDEEFPEICREEIREYDGGIKGFARELLGLLCEGLGVNTRKLEDMTCVEARIMVAHYYPQCPQPDLTFGITSHSDPGVITILLQDEVGGLQIKHGDEWLDVKPVPGALVINIGDILQIMSNDEYQSVDHRVLANPNPQPRVSIAVFFNPSDRAQTFGPFPELATSEKLAAFKQFTFSDYLQRFFSKQLDAPLVSSWMPYFPASTNELDHVFKKFDVNEDRKISASEHGAIFASLGYTEMKEELQKMVREVDADGDCCISFEEFVELNTKGVDGDKIMANLREAFSVYNRDGNGEITAEELHDVLKS